MATYRYAGYPSAHVYDDDRKTKKKHLLWGDWVRLEGQEDDGWFPVRVRGVDGWIRRGDLQEERLLELVFVDVGQGDGALVITPDDKHVVVDGGIGDHMSRFLRWRYNGFKKKWRFKAGILTHPDQDHYGGFGAVLDDPNVHFDTLYHNGIMEESGDDPLGPTQSDGGRRYLTGLVEDRASLEAFLASGSRWRSPKGTQYDKRYPTLLHAATTNGRVDDIRMLSTRHGEVHGGQSYVPGFGPDRPLSIEVIGPVVEPDNADRARLRWFKDRPDGGSYDVGKTKNGHSVILKLTYRDLTVLFGGDLNTSSQAFLLSHYAKLDAPAATAHEEDLLVAAARPTLEAADVKSCHHGSSDILDAFLRATNPAATVVSSGDEEAHAHPRCDTLGAIGRYGRGHRPLILSTELMRSTREREPDDLVLRLGRLRALRDAAVTPEERKKADRLIDEVSDELTKRNVTVYGAINLRSDGRRAVLAYMLEQPKRGKRWDIYRLERVGNGPFTFVGGG